MDDHDITHFEWEQETRRRCPSGNRAARGVHAGRPGRLLLEVSLGEPCRFLCGANIRQVSPVGSGGARPLRAPLRTFNCLCLVVPGRPQ
jgi:hypothetical protein